MNCFKVGDKKIGEDNPIFLIAEAGVNHNGSLSIARSLVDVAADSGVDAIKFQTYKTEKLILQSTEKASYQQSKVNKEESFYEMLKKYELEEGNFKILKEYCDEKGLIFLSTPFDTSSVELLEDLNVPAYKIGSGDMNNFPLIKLICSKGKPILLSTGMATLEEVKDSVDLIKNNSVEEVVIFQCTTSYPTKLEDVNLNVIDLYKKEFPNEIIGFSDHSQGITASIGAAAKGAKVIEKHFTLDKEMEGPDHKASLDPTELRKWVNEIRNLEKALGFNKKIRIKSELELSKIARKSIVSIKDLKKGEILSEDNIGIKRPGTGISPKEFEKILGRSINKDILKDSVIFWEDVD